MYSKEVIEPRPTVEELVELLRKAKATNDKDVKTPSRYILTDADHAVNNYASFRETRKALLNEADLAAMDG